MDADLRDSMCVRERATLDASAYLFPGGVRLKTALGCYRLGIMNLTLLNLLDLDFINLKP